MSDNSKDWLNEKQQQGDNYTSVYVDEKSSANSSAGSEPVAIQSNESSRLAVLGAVSFYMVAALIMIIVNKLVLNAVSVPIFFLFCQLVIAVLLLNLSALFGYFSIPPIRMQTAKDLMPLVGINCTGLIFNTYCLALVDASFYQVARGLVLPFTVLFSYILLSQRSTSQVLLAVAVVCLGFFFGVSSEALTVSKLGVFMGVTSSLTTSIHAIVVKRSLPIVQGDTMALAYYNNALSAVIVAPVIVLVGEWPKAADMFLVGGENLKTFLVGAAVTGVFGFLICIAGFLSIKITSPVTHMISSAVRGVIQTMLGYSIFGDVISSGRLSGIGLILGGSILYTYAKSQESKPAIALPGSPQTPARTPRPSSAHFIASPYAASLSTPMLRNTSTSSTSSAAAAGADSEPLLATTTTQGDHSQITFMVQAPHDEKAKYS